MSEAGIHFVHELHWQGEAGGGGRERRGWLDAIGCLFRFEGRRLHILESGLRLGGIDRGLRHEARTVALEESEHRSSERMIRQEAERAPYQIAWRNGPRVKVQQPRHELAEPYVDHPRD